MSYTSEKTFDKIDFTQSPLPKGEYEGCTFVNCDLSGTDLGGTVFTDCRFTGCNISTAKLQKTAFRECDFKDCKLLGLHFHNCNEFLFSVSFDNCLLNLSSFYKLKLKKTRFVNCSLHEADFTEADLTAALFDNCDLAGTTFDRTVLETADLRTAYNYTIDPENNKIKKAKFSAMGIAGLLAKYNIVIE